MLYSGTPLGEAAAPAVAVAAAFLSASLPGVSAPLSFAAAAASPSGDAAAAPLSAVAPAAAVAVDGSKKAAGGEGQARARFEVRLGDEAAAARVG